MKPLISVIIPAYNEEKLIATCLKAVKDQTFSSEKYEILLVDNNSTDNTAQIAKELGAKVYSYTEKQGFSVAKQYGTSVARGEIIAFTDADSIPDKHWLTTIEKIMHNPTLQCIGGTILATDANAFMKYSFVFYDFVARLQQRLLHVSLIWSPNMAIRKDAFEKIGGFNLRLKTSDDWDLVMRVQREYGLDSTLYTKKLHVTTSSRKQQKVRFLVPYLLIGFLNYFSIFILRKSITYGTHTALR